MSFFEGGQAGDSHALTRSVLGFEDTEKSFRKVLAFFAGDRPLSSRNFGHAIINKLTSGNNERLSLLLFKLEIAQQIIRFQISPSHRITKTAGERRGLERSSRVPQIELI